MSKVDPRPRPQQSVFAKLLAIMLAMALSLLLVVAAFFLLYLSPAVRSSFDRLGEEYAQLLAATAPDQGTAARIGERLDVQIRYEGPAGTWTTSPDLPTVAEARSGHARHYYVAPSPDGGAYLFGWAFSDRMNRAHLVVLPALLLLMTTIVFAAHAVLRRLLLPLRWLGDGVAGLSEGDLDVNVPKRSSDEFGVLTDAFNRMVARVKDMIRARDQLLLDVSHELRSPVTRLKVALELIGDARMKARMASDLADIDVLIGELLELERLRDGRRARTTRQDIRLMLDEVARNFEDRPPGIRVVAETPAIVAQVDADMIRTLLRNLMENAVKYSLPDSRPVEVHAAEDGDAVVIRVTDDGVGIPASDIENVFEPFFRVDRSRSRKPGGYGLGLSISKRIADVHGGTIAVKKTAPRGTTFTVILPKSAVNASA